MMVGTLHLIWMVLYTFFVGNQILKVSIFFIKEL